MNLPSPSASDQRARRPKLLRPIRLSTFLLLMPVIALLIALYAQMLREARLQDAIAVYRDFPSEGMVDALDRPIALNYPDGADLDSFLKTLKATTTKNPKMPKIPNGIPIYVDPIGLDEAEKSMGSPVARPPGADSLTLHEHLRRVLEPMGLYYTAKDGFVLITSRWTPDATVCLSEPIDAPVGDAVDPVAGPPEVLYLRYRDVLR